MNLNLVVLAGKVAAPILTLEGAEGDQRLLVLVEGEGRTDLIPIRTGGPPRQPLEQGCRVWVAGALERHHQPATGRSRLEVTARDIQLQRVDSLAGGL